MSEDLHYVEVLDLLGRIHSVRPDIRFGQVLQLVVDKESRTKNVDLHNFGSKRLADALVVFLDNLERGGSI